MLRRAVADGAHVVTSSDATTRRVRDLLDTERVRTVLLGPPVLDAPTATLDDSPHPPTGLPELTEFVLALGTMERRKNLPTLVDAFGRLAREHPTVRLVMAGSLGNDANAVERAINRLDPAIAERVVRTGPVGDDAKRWLLAHARTLAYPGFGFPILEAQQQGVPVVASTGGSIPQVAGPAALLSPPLDAEALAANLYWIVTSDDMHAKLVRRGRVNLQRFSWADTASRLRDLYLRLAEARTGAVG